MRGWVESGRPLVSLCLYPYLLRLQVHTCQQEVLGLSGRGFKNYSSLSLVLLVCLYSPPLSGWQFSSEFLWTTLYLPYKIVHLQNGDTVLSRGAGTSFWGLDLPPCRCLQDTATVVQGRRHSRCLELRRERVGEWQHTKNNIFDKQNCEKVEFHEPGNSLEIYWKLNINKKSLSYQILLL